MALVNRLQEIRARLTAIREGYAVHIGCGGECTPHNPLGTRYRCCACDEDVPIESVAEKADPALSYVEDVEYLLRGLGERMTHIQECALWERVNEYAESCGGDTTNNTVTDRRMDAVVALNREVEAIKSHIPSLPSGGRL